MSTGSILTIILNYRTPEMTLRAAEAALVEMADLSGGVLVIDNGSGDGSWEALQAGAAQRGWQASDKIRLLQSPVNGGFGAGMNIGFAAGLSDGTAPDYYYLLNSDAFVQGQTMRTLRDFLADHPGAGLAGSFVHGTDGTPHRTAFRFPSIAGEFEMAARTGVFTRLLHPWVVAMEMPRTQTQVDWTAGASLMIRRQVIEDIGGFDETFFLYFEETDLCRRAAQAGWRTHYVPDSQVAHLGSASTGMKDWDRTPAYWFQSRSHYFAKSHGRAYAALATLARIAGTGLYALRRLVQGKPQADPNHFLKDLISHSLAPVSHKPSPPCETRLHSPVSEDPK
ncbi:glycosyltransferase family 2 protein [Pseudophaeobacter sp.]|uniref:glycosyltransferase family 2 protein n=1 Tax=Pseudophaeobacter sp. TaxID=1971739 RepID=UPI0025E626E6|nr:glycosyltransferase family 2 protein [uncultured Pseudophaeobacter sp.]